MAQALTLAFVSPIIVTILSIFYLKEKVGIHRWSAVIIGFIGVLIIIRPGFLEINFASISAIGAGTAYAFYIIYTRKLSFIDSPVVTLLFTGVVGCILISINFTFLLLDKFRFETITIINFVSFYWSSCTFFNYFIFKDW